MSAEEAEQAQRPPDLTPEEFGLLTPVEKKQRLEQFAAYSDRFPLGKYPLREQQNSEYQRYADSQRAEGYGPPGIYL